MIELLSQLALLLLAGGCGVLIGQAWIRRRHDDERERRTEPPDYGPQLAALRTELQALRPQGTVLLRLPATAGPGEADAVDVARQLAAFDGRLAGLEASLQALHKADATKMKRTDAAALLERISAVEAAVAGVPAADLSPISRRVDEVQALLRTLEPPPPVDLRPVHKQLQSLLDAVQGIRLPEPPDLKPLQRQLTAVQETVGQIHVPDAVDLKPVYKQIAALEGAVHAIEIPRPPDPVDLTPVREKLGVLSGLVEAIRIPPPPDLTPLQAKLTKVEQAVREIEIPQPPLAPDLSPLAEALARLEQMVAHLPAPPDVGSIKRKLKNIEERIMGLPIPGPVDVKPLQKQVASVKKAIYEIRRSELPHPASEGPPLHAVPDAPASTTDELGDVDALYQRLDELEQSIGDRPSLGPDDLAPLHERLARLDAMVCQALEAPSPAAPLPEAQPELLETPDLGPADDLKVISGVGPKLERALNRLGVWYYAQIAAWSDEEVRYVDRRLEGFRGRIQRHGCVAQAAELVGADDRAEPETSEGKASSSTAPLASGGFGPGA